MTSSRASTKTSGKAPEHASAAAQQEGQPEREGEQRLTQAAENYLLAIYIVKEQGLDVTNSNLVSQLKRTPASEHLGTSLPSIAGMLRRMEREGLIRYTDSREIELTDEGQRQADTIVRRHRLAERMVVDLLGLELQKAHVEAHRLEHAMSEELEERIKAVLGNPGTCPFGHPIPGSGYVPCQGSLPLSEAPVGESLIVDRIPEEESDLLEYLVSSELLPGAEVEVTESAPYRGVISLSTRQGSAVLGAEVASRIWVCPRTCGHDCESRSIMTFQL
ncbi:MAG: metal-dependent transcriptional regulator [Chloroflexota bacterium]